MLSLELHVAQGSLGVLKFFPTAFQLHNFVGNEHERIVVVTAHSILGFSTNVTSCPHEVWWGAIEHKLLLLSAASTDIENNTKQKKRG